MIKFTETTVTKVGSEIANDYQYDINARVVNNELAEVNCNILKKVIMPYDDGNGGTQNMMENHSVGYIRFVAGRIATEISSDEDVIQHITKFSEIMEFIRKDMIVTE